MIDPNREYSINEIVRLQLIPGVKGYAKVYNLITRKEQKDISSTKISHTPVEETTRTSIKAEALKVPGNVISSKYFIRGAEIIKFLQLNNL